MKREGYRQPQKLMNYWLLATLLMFAIGPIVYSDCNKIYAILYMIVFLAFANAFYYLGSHVGVRTYRKKFFWKKNKLIRVTLYYSLGITLLYFAESIVRYGFTSFNLSSFFQTMANTYTFQNEYNFMISAWILSYTKWIRVIGLVLGSVYWKELKKSERIVYIITIIVIVIHNTVFTGSQKELIDVVIYVGLPVVMNWYRKGNHLNIKRKLVFLAAGIAILLFMGTVIESRHLMWQQMFSSQSSLRIDTDNWLYVLLPEKNADAWVYIMSYLTQGYRGLALCLTLPFKWTYGVGNSFKLMNDISRWFSIPLSALENTYPVRMQAAYGVGAYSSWHSIFPWYASDFTFIGAIIIVSIFIFYWGKSWREFVQCDSWISAVMFNQLTILVLYIPCNNQLFQTRDSIVATIVIFIFWFLFHGKERTIV